MATKGQKLLAAGTAFIASEPLIQAISHGPTGVGVGVIAGLVVGGIAYNAIDDVERITGKELPSLPQTNPASPEQPSLVYRMLNGKSTRENSSHTTKSPQEEVQQQSYYPRRSQDLSKLRQNIVPPGGYKPNVDTEPIAAVSMQRKKGFKPLPPVVMQQQIELSLDPRFPVPIDMAKIIENGFCPTRKTIFLLNTPDGHATEAIRDLGHIGLAGSTGGGKTNINRLITSQLLYCGAKVFMINPNHAPVKRNGDRMEDWRPIMARLQAPVAREASEITALLNYFMKIFKDRQNREQITPKRGSDIFLVIGEWPVVVEECPEAVDKVSRLLRQARQYGIHILAEYQDALVKTIGGSSGTRANYGTVYFAGGDSTTAKVLLKPPEGVKLDLTGLGKNGAVYLRSHSHHAITGRVPFFSNKALYMLLGFPEDPVTDEIVSEDDFYEEDEEDIEEIFAKMPDIRNDDGELEEEDEDYPFSPSRQSETPKLLVPIMPDKGPRAEDIDIDILIAVWNGGGNSIGKLQKIFKMTNHQAQLARKRVLESAKTHLEEAID